MRTFRAVAIDFLTWLKRDKRTLLSRPEQIYIDPRPYTIASYEPPSPTTDGKLLSQSPRYRNASQSPQAQLDALIRHEIRMSQQHRKVQDTEPHTAILQAIPKLHKIALVPESEPPPGSTLYETPAFLEDQHRKVS